MRLWATIFYIPLLVQCSTGDSASGLHSRYAVDSRASAVDCLGRASPLADGTNVGYHRVFCASNQDLALQACKEHCEANLPDTGVCPNGAVCVCEITEEYPRACNAPASGVARSDDFSP